MSYIKLVRMFAIVSITAIATSGCVATSGSVRESESTVGPSLSSSYQKQEETPYKAAISGPRLDVIVPVFDPGIPADFGEAKDKGIWPELRRAEANRFAYKLKRALEDTGRFGAVRVTPTKKATGDLYVLGKIEESNGEKVSLQIKVYDISERKWVDKEFEHRVADGFYGDQRNRGKDPYDPVFIKTAKYIAEQLNDRSSKELTDLQRLTEVRFGASFSEEKFSQYLKPSEEHAFLFFGHESKVTLASLPSDDDPMFRRTRSIRIRDQLFVDRMQSHYESFSQKMDTSYAVWQEGSSAQIKAIREAENKATTQAIVGVLLLAGAAYAAGHSNRSNAPVATTAAVVAGISGAMMLSNSVQTMREANVYEDALSELGQSLDIEMAPQVVKFEKTTARLTGDAAEQFSQWRAFLQKIYLAESVPDVQL